MPMPPSFMATFGHCASCGCCCARSETVPVFYRHSGPRPGWRQVEDNLRIGKGGARSTEFGQLRFQYKRVERQSPAGVGDGKPATEFRRPEDVGFAMAPTYLWSES